MKAQDLTFESSGADATLVELYSSEGCSSCPPAESWLGSLKDSPRLWHDLFPADFHVDYWDGLGWPDRFARPEFTARQRDYATRLGQDSVYTPEFVVNGREWRGWFAGEPLSTTRDTSGKLTVSMRGQGRSTSLLYAAPAGGAARDLTGHVAVLGMNIVSDIKRGENGGRQLRHDFVVLGFVSGPLTVNADGNAELQWTDIATTTNDPPAAVVGWVDAGDGALIQIAGGWLQPETAAH